MRRAGLRVRLLLGVVGGIPVCAAQLFFSLVCRAFAPPVAFGLIGGMLGLLFLGQGWGYAFPYSLLALGMRANNPELTLELAPFLLACAAYTVLFAMLSIRFMQRREVTGE